MMETDRSWVAIGSADDIARRKKVVVDIEGRQILVLAHDSRFYAFDNICVHRRRELSKGVILNGKIVCPGHQWAFALDTGWEAVKEECQPTHLVRVTDGVIEVGLTPASTESVDRDSVRAWVDGWGAEVAAVDVAAARNRFEPDVSAFGTHADVVSGLEKLVAEQWAPIWPSIDDFRFLTDEMQVIVSPDRLLAVAVVGWSSTGIAEDGSRFDRPGRATVVMKRAAIDAEWVGTHTHFSLGRGVPQNTYGSRPAH